MKSDILSQHNKLRLEYKEQKGIPSHKALDTTGYILWLENKVLLSTKEKEEPESDINIHKRVWNPTNRWKL